MSRLTNPPAIALLVALFVSTPAAAQSPLAEGQWIGGITSHGAYAPFRLVVRRGGTDSLQAELLGFSFLGFGAVPARVERVADSSTLTVRDWTGAEHRITWRGDEERVTGVYDSPRGPGVAYLRRLPMASDTGATIPAPALYRSARGDFVATRPIQDDLILVDFSNGMRRRAARVGSGRFVHGYLYDDWSEIEGEISPLPAAGRSRFIWTRRQAAGLTTVDTLVLVELEEEEVTFRQADATLAGTLIVPPGNPEAKPAAVFVHGSGSADRETNRELAYFMASRGIAALIFDKRGVARSTGRLEGAGLEDLAQDGAAAVRFLQQRPEVRPRCVGIHGTSQGGWVAPLTAVLLPDVRFVMTMSGPGVPSDRQELYRRTLNLRGTGFIPGHAFDPPQVERALETMRAFFGWVRDERDGEAVARLLRERHSEPWFATTELPDSLDLLAPPSFVQSFRSGMRFDVLGTWRRVSVPSLQVFGALDPFVPVDESVAVFRQFDRPDARIVVFPRADHWMYDRSPAAPRMPSNGYTPGYLSLLAEWLDEVTGSCR